MSIVIRPPEPHERRASADAMRAALMFGPASDEEWAKSEPSWMDHDAVTAWDGERCVGHAGAFRFDTTVPGGARLETAGVTRIGVLPTHTRRGLLRGMIEQLLTGARDRGQVLASLRASEAVIYGRFGFGVAGELHAVKVRSATARPVRAPAEGTIRLLGRDEILTVVPDLYDRCARHRVGTIRRPEWMWKRFLADALEGTKASFVAVHEDSTGTPDGYVHYTLTWDEDADTADRPGKGTIEDLFGVDPAVERALWAYVLDVDLVAEWSSDERPIDDVAKWSIADPRAYRAIRREDEQWLRVLDADIALGARTYGPTDRAVTVQVRDPMFSANSGTWRIDAYGAFRSHADPDLAVGIETLSAAYLGGTSWRELTDAGRVVVRRPDAVADADALFATRPLPFCGSFF